MSALDVPVGRYDHGPHYGSGTVVGYDALPASAEVDARVAAGSPAYWPSVYIDDDGTVEVADVRLTLAHFRVWLAACTAAVTS